MDDHMKRVAERATVKLTCGWTPEKVKAHLRNCGWLSEQADEIVTYAQQKLADHKASEN